MIARCLILASALLAATAPVAVAQSLAERADVIAAPVLRANVQVTSDIVRIGDLIDNAGSAAQIAIYRAPDLGTTGSLPVPQVINALRMHQVIGVDTRELKEISVTRLARAIDGKDIEAQIGRALERKNGLGDAANLSLTFDRDPGDIKLDAGFTGAMQPTTVRFDNRNGRFDITFEIANDSGISGTKLRFTGTAVETVEAAVLARSVERNEILKSSDVVVERRPKAEVGGEAASRDRAVGMQARRQLRAGQPIRIADLVKPDLVQRDQSVTLIYETPGLYLTVRGKALDGGTEGDVVNVMNLQSKRTVTGVVTGRGQVTISNIPSRPAPVADTTSSLEAPNSSTSSSTAPVAVANASSVAAKTE